MKIKLINEEIVKTNNSIIETIFMNRGIPKEEIRDFLNTPDNVLIDYNKLDNIDKAANCILKHYKNNSEILIQVD